MEKIFKQTANQNNTTEAEVKKEISDAIKQAMENPNLTPYAAEFWNSISKAGSTPSPEDVVNAIVERLITTKLP